MTREDAIELIEIAKAEIEWEYPFDYQVAFDKAIKALEQEPCEDCISRDMLLEKMADYVSSGYADSAEDFEAYSKIICDLPSVNPQEPKTNRDCISRQSVLDIDFNRIFVTCAKPNEMIRRKIAELPSVTPAPKMGRWKKENPPMVERYPFCSECGFVNPFENALNYCPNCGAKMSEIPTCSESESSSEKPNK